MLTSCLATEDANLARRPMAARAIASEHDIANMANHQRSYTNYTKPLHCLRCNTQPPTHAPRRAGLCRYLCCDRPKCFQGPSTLTAATTTATAVASVVIRPC